MLPVERDNIVQAFATDRANQSFAMSMGGRHAKRRSQDSNAPAFYFLVETGGERLVPIMQQKLVMLIPGLCFPELFYGPLRSRTLGDVAVNWPSGADLECDQYIKGCGNLR